MVESTGPLGQELVHIDLAKIKPNPLQPRRFFDEQRIDELAQSIKENGLIQPIVVTRFGRGYRLVSGERRFRACQSLGFSKIPAVISRDLSVSEGIKVALIENLQREGLSPVEEAEVYQRLMAEFSYTQERVAKEVGKSRPHVANMLRLLRLPAVVREALQDGRLEMGHARALLSLSDEQKIVGVWQQVRDRGLSVRACEDLVRKLKFASDESTELNGFSGSGRVGQNQPQSQKSSDPDLRYMEECLNSALRTRVRVSGSASNGVVAITYSSESDLDRIYQILLSSS